MALPNKTKIPVGTVLAGKYRITREIGRGGMAAVYEAANVDIGKRVAIKVLAQELTTSAVVVERFLREARAAAAIRSPYICDIYDSGRLDDGRPFLVLELLEGESLYERMTKIRWLDIETTVSIVTQVCRGLTKAHAANIVHRDLKPENIFLTKDEEGKLLSKILDFGLAKFYTSMEADGPQARLTREGAVFGTPAYMSPEQVRGQGAVDNRADLWALGCIVYECFTGRTVWSTEQGVAMTFAQIANAQLPRPSAYRPDLPEAFTEWFDKALDRDITKRFQSAKEFAERFSAVFNKEKPEISTIMSTPALLRDLSKDTLENPFLSGPDIAPTSAEGKARPSGPTPEPTSKPGAQVSVVPSGGSRQVAPDAVTEPPPARTSVNGPASATPRTSESPELAAGPPSPRPSKLGFASPEADGGKRAQRRSPAARAAMFLGGAAVVGGLGYLVWTQLADAPQPGHSGTDSSADASAASAPSTSAEPTATPTARPEAPALPWMPAVREGQQALAAGDLNKAKGLFKDAVDHFGAHPVPKALFEQITVALVGGDKGPCHLAGLGRPRSYDLPPIPTKGTPIPRPAIALGPRGVVVAWTDVRDARDQREHAYMVTLDDAMRDTDAPLDVTPEAQSTQHPDLYVVGDKILLLYADAKGPEAGVHARFIEADGRFSGPVVAVSPPKPYTYYPSLAPAPDGTFFVAWADERDNDSEDLFLRHLGHTLEPIGEPIRATDLVSAGPKARARFPTVEVASGAVQIAFRLDRDPMRVVEHLRVPLADATNGLPPPKKGERKDRNIGDMVLVNTDKSKSDVPVFACGGGSCYVAWHNEQSGGVWVARLDPASGKSSGRWQVSRTGSQVAVTVSSKGDAQVAWFESKQLFTAAISGDRQGPASRVARAGAEVPFSIARGKQLGEWYVAWIDGDNAHHEVFAARVQCK